jgi:hypothetical protein
MVRLLKWDFGFKMATVEEIASRIQGGQVHGCCFACLLLGKK